MGEGQNFTTLGQVLVLGSVYQGAFLGLPTIFDPRPFPKMTLGGVLLLICSMGVLLGEIDGFPW